MPNRSYRQKPTTIKYLIDALKIQTDECQIWPFSKDSDGYGKAYMDGRCWQAHRLSKKLTDPDFDESLGCLHTCDNPPCFNPQHLFQGTNADNAKDRDSKGRGHWQQPNWKPPAVKFWQHRKGHAINPERIRDVRARWANGESQSSIARHFGVPRTAIHRIVRGRTWKHVS